MGEARRGAERHLPYDGRKQHVYSMALTSSFSGCFMGERQQGAEKLCRKLQTLSREGGVLPLPPREVNEPSSPTPQSVGSGGRESHSTVHSAQRPTVQSGGEPGLGEQGREAWGPHGGSLAFGAASVGRDDPSPPTASLSAPWAPRHLWLQT